MYNTDIPTRAELPTSRQLMRSTILAAVTAAALLLTVILPAEYGIDPTGTGKILGLKQMGEIKVQLQNEAAEDNITRPRGSTLWNLIISTAHAQSAWKDETTLTLQPGEGAEVKTTLTKGQKISYSWSATGKVNHDTHGEPTGNPNATTSYSKDRGVEKDEGTLIAPFDGSHGWFWRNRGTEAVTLTLKTTGDYSEIKRVK
ncbi:transmembrane anchor protein [Filomicrobium sp.]|uniref:transmembrane anchor protein n=1 Tax=Filomicrobium sp. TaxID=2024831 RepID=UPI002585B614|nr:transmembrane anchor protein [Filomicrobium sp.]MCV0371787.1 transmembrane anchor protein [Filomicrobium sp.]